MDEVLFIDLIQSLNEAIDYAKGDKSKGRSIIVAVPDEEIEIDQMIILQLGKLSLENKEKVVRYANELLQTSNV